jgi:hypothetical protein
MSQIFSIQDDKVVIKTLAVEQIQDDVSITGTLTVNSLKVLEEDSKTALAPDFGNWSSLEETDLYDKGISWTWGVEKVRLGYRSGARMWASSDFDLAANKSFMIEGVPVLSKDSLGGGITKSNLKEIGSLRSLTVNGDATIADFAVFNSSFGRLGLNTDSPNGVLSVVDNNVEVIITSPKDNLAQLGTYTNHDLELITDNLPRVTLKNNGQVIFGNEQTKNADVKIYGTLTVDTVVADNRIDRFQPLEFKTSKDRGIYGQGLVWTGTGDMRQFIMMAGPDRLYSSETIEIADNQSFMIGGQTVLSKVGLGNTVTQSNLSKLGSLEELNVAGEATFYNRLNATRSVIDARVIKFTDSSEFTISNGSLSSNNKVSIDINGIEKFYADKNEIIIGDSRDNRNILKVFGKMSIGVNSPSEDVDLAVKGNIQFSNKKFVTGATIPVSGDFAKGDICWNSNPTPDNYVGWICTEGGAPGQWLPFGMIARQ